jgi:hypothetical protein
VALERAWQPICIRYGVATRLTPGPYLDAAKPGVIPALPSSVEWPAGTKDDLPIDCSPLEGA